MPSAFRVSKAYSISRRLPSASGSGMAAKKRNRPGWSRPSWAQNSLHSRASFRVSSSTWPYQGPGLMIETIEVAMPPLSISSSDIDTDHFGMPLIRAAAALSCAGGTTWWWTSIRCGLDAASAVAAPRPAMPSPTAAPPARKRLRFTAVLANPALGPQPAHPHRRALRLKVMVMNVSPWRLLGGGNGRCSFGGGQVPPGRRPDRIRAACRRGSAASGEWRRRQRFGEFSSA